VLQIRGLSKSFGPRAVLHDVSFDVAAGEIVALVGENGAGKSTLVKCVGGVLTPDSGSVRAPGKIAAVWQDLALCDNLDAVANVFLGVERSKFVLDEASMLREARRVFDEIGVPPPPLSAPVGELSGGQRQMVAFARAVMSNAAVLLLDEPTAALGVVNAAAIDQVIAGLRARGMAIVMVSHRIDQVFALADRIVVMRHGHIEATVSPREVHPDDVVALMSGVATDSIARQQLHRLRALVDDLAEVEPSASLPLILTSLSRSISSESIGLWLVDERQEALVWHAGVAMPDDLQAVLQRRPAAGPGPIEMALRSGVVIVEDGAADPSLAPSVGSLWAVAVPGRSGAVGVIGGFSPRPGRPGADQIELVVLHANLAAAAIDREALLGELTQRNRVLESLRGLLDQLAGPAPVEAGIDVALTPLCQALDAQCVALYEGHGVLHERAATVGDNTTDRTEMSELVASMPLVAAVLHRAQIIAAGTVAVSVLVGERNVALAARWREPAAVTKESLDLLEDAARSLALALERESAEAAVRETETLREANEIQREFLHRLSHELRTPLTAISGYADTLRQQDVEWEPTTRERFLDRIASESTRMGRLVSDLLDTSAISGGQLRLRLDWCDVGLLVEEAAGVVAMSGDGILTIEIAERVPPILADHDRIEQVLVNGLDNARKHGSPPIRVTVSVSDDGDFVAIEIIDHGPGPQTDDYERVFDAYAHFSLSPGAGIGLTIARGIAEAHGGSLHLRRRGNSTVLELRLPVEPTLDPRASLGEFDEVGA
jgi:signal transduction histidine kinase/ABC-type multidrug transport system ATPase subunit